MLMFVMVFHFSIVILNVIAIDLIHFERRQWVADYAGSPFEIFAHILSGKQRWQITFIKQLLWNLVRWIDSHFSSFHIQLYRANIVLGWNSIWKFQWLQSNQMFHFIQHFVIMRCVGNNHWLFGLSLVKPKTTKDQFLLPEISQN